MVDKQYWNSESTTQHAVEASKIFVGMSMGFFFYDWILAANFEWSILTGRRQRRWPQVVYFLTRICMTAYFVICLIINYTQHQIDCQIAFYMLEMLMAWTVVSSSVLLACRTIFVYEGAARQLVTATLAILAVGLLAAWMQGVKSVTGTWVPGQGFAFADGACVWSAASDDYWVKYVCTIIFDAVVLFLTAFGIVQMSGSSRIGVVLVRQGIVYFLLTFLVNLLIAIFTLLHLSPTMSLLLAVPQATVCVICACRLYINLAKEARADSFTSSGSPTYASRLGREPADQSGSDSYGSTAKRSRLGKVTGMLFHNGAGMHDTAVPSYFSSSSAPRVRQHTDTSDGNRNGYADAKPANGSHCDGSLPNSHSSAEDLEKQTARSTVSGEADHFYDSRSTPYGSGRRSPDQMAQEHDQVDIAQLAAHRQFGARVPQRQSSNGYVHPAPQFATAARKTYASPALPDRKGDIQVDAGNYVVVDSAPSYHESVSRRPRAATAYHPSDVSSARPTSAGNQAGQDDEVVRVNHARFVARKDPSRP